MRKPEQPAKPSQRARRTWARVREFALGLPGATEEFPWGETVAKVNKKVFVFLGVDDGTYPMGMTVKLTDEAAHAHALTAPGAAPAGYGLGKAGWVRIPLDEKQTPAAELLCDWVEESYRAVAPKKRVAELDEGGGTGTGDH
ncbi:MmcQ/YjbR family DNA-binding protein [Streptomyces sp. NPDC050095]|uniref:MmcQ/YjbR family DNA-binding protein n=1 Tax=unclassified Streptomyces TaxID=2593676 RepID=UPI003413A247